MVKQSLNITVPGLLTVPRLNIPSALSILLQNFQK